MAGTGDLVSGRNVIPAPDYRLIVTRPQVSGETGRAWTDEPLRMSIVVESGRQLTGIRMELAPVGSISGRVLDDKGRPQRGVTVAATKTTYRSGVREVAMRKGSLDAAVSHAETNNRGEYRLIGLPAGQYYVSASEDRFHSIGACLFTSLSLASGPLNTAMMQRRPISFDVPAFFPNKDLQTATPIDLHGGETRGGVDLTENPSAPVRTLHGEVVDISTGKRVSGAQISIVPRSAFEMASILACPTDTLDGSFDVFTPPGSFDLVATVPGTGSSPFMTGRTTVNVGTANIKDIRVTVSPEFSVPGNFTFEGRTAPTIPELSSLVLLSPRQIPEPFFPRPGVDPPSIVTLPDMRVELHGLLPWNYRAVFPSDSPPGLSENFYIKSIHLGAVDLLKEELHIDGSPAGALEIVIGSDGATLSGTILGEIQNDTSAARVVLVPSPPLRGNSLSFRVTHYDRSGKFQLQSIPPGDYKLFVWKAVDDGAWGDPEFLRLHEDRGLPIHFDARSHQAIEIPIPLSR